MKKYVFLLPLFLILGLVVSCNSFNVSTDYLKSTNFAQYKTFEIRTDHLKLNDIDKQRVIDNITKTLTEKGLSVSASSDLIVNITASHKTVQDLQPRYSFGWDWRPWYSPWGFGMGTAWTQSYNSGKLTVDLIDAKTNKLVWQGIGDGINVDSPKSKQKQIPEIISQILGNYPPKTK
ncbi:DUF4136 domain-containing protein [Riemerella columbipharyngis]|uniref:DUF4136 domain-containing protein n=1 Tax=Riemerella columbipharyngis TaxID=1071918 RepID=A0A1G6YQM8_9FLAO|nr:DUF4136 domain-containing protein [Riemerella columbipharyngis]SDD92794.1 protein of unknown function [Riemerella columbipharyngis]